MQLSWVRLRECQCQCHELQYREKHTCKIDATFRQLMLKNFLMSWERVLGDGTMTLLLRSVRMLMNLGSAMMENGWWRYTTQRASFIRSLGAEYVEPWANKAMAWKAAESEGSQPSAWQTKLLVLLLCWVRKTLMDGWLEMGDRLVFRHNFNHIKETYCLHTKTYLTEAPS